MTRDGALQLFDGLFGTGPPMGVPHSAGALEDVGPPMVAPYWCDSSNGEVTYGSIRMGVAGADIQLQKADDCVGKGFPLKAPPFRSASLFIATWTNVQPPGGGQVNILFYYGDFCGDFGGITSPYKSNTYLKIMKSVCNIMRLGTVIF